MNLIEITNKSGRILLDDAVTKDSVDRLIGEMDTIFGNDAVGKPFGPSNIVASAEKAVDELEIEINSGGGSVLEGHRLFHSIKRMQASGVKVTAKITALAGSMASVICMAADEVHMVPGGRMMIHEASTTTWGDAATHARQAKLLDEMSAEIAEIYAKKTGMSSDEARAMMLDETWMGATEAMEKGFIDLVLNDETEETYESNHTEPMFNSRKDLTAKVEALESDAADLEAAIQNYEQELGEVKAEALAATEALVAAERSLDAKDAELDEIKAELEDAKAKSTDEAINALVTAQIAAAGHPPLDTEEADSNEENTISDEDLKRKFENASVQELINLKRTDAETYARLRSL